MVETVRTRPKAVDIAVKLLYAQAFISVIYTILNFQTIEQNAQIFDNIWYNTIPYVVVYLLMVVHIYFISKGANWARDLYLIFVILGVLATVSFYVFKDFFPTTPTEQIFGIITVFIDLIALFLLFSPSAKTFFFKTPPRNA